MNPSLDPIRLERNRAALRAACLAGVVATLGENVLLLSGAWPRAGLNLVWFPAEGDPALLTPDSEADEAATGFIRDIRPFKGELDGDETIRQMQAFLHAVLPTTGKIGYEGSFRAVAPPPLAGEPRVVDQSFIAMLSAITGSDRLHDATETLYIMRARKTARELDALRKAHRVAAVGLETFRAITKPGITEIEIAAEVERAIQVAGIIDHGGRSVRAWAQVGSGVSTATAWQLYVQPTARTLETGDLALLELGVVVDGFWADLTRAAVAREPTAKQIEVWGVVAEAQQAAVDRIRPGVRAGAVDAAARDHIAARGYGQYFPHVTGHGLGFRYHELPPLLKNGSADILEEGMIVSVEPGIYIPGWGGIRIEDNIAVTADGAERLSPPPIPLSFPLPKPLPRHL